MTEFTPTRDDKFSFGLWTVGWQGVDVFGTAVRDPLAPAEAVSDMGAYGVTFRDNDMFPFGSGPEQKSERLKPFRKALDETGGPRRCREWCGKGCASGSRSLPRGIQRARRLRAGTRL